MTTTLLILEYEHLKEEQRQRIATRDNLVYATLAAMAVLGGGMLQARWLALLLFAPPVVLVLGWTHVVNDQKVSAIRRYIEQVIAPGLGADAFGWERRHRLDRRARSRKVGQLAADLLVFCLPGVLAPLCYVLLSPARWLAAVAVLEMAGGVLLAGQVLAYSELRGGGRA